MGKRSNFERAGRDFYPTPDEAVIPLLPHLPDCAGFVEPCAGDGALVRSLEVRGHACMWKSDIEPQADDIIEADVESLMLRCNSADMVITNPPWKWEFVDPFLSQCAKVWRLPVWLLLAGDFAHNQRSTPHLERCSRIVSIGRVKWIAESKWRSKDNCAWFKFETDTTPVTAFFGREKVHAERKGS